MTLTKLEYYFRPKTTYYVYTLLMHGNHYLYIYSVIIKRLWLFYITRLISSYCFVVEVFTMMPIISQIIIANTCITIM